MNATELVTALEDLGAVLTLVGDTIQIQAPAGVVDDELRDVIRDWTPDLIKVLASRAEPAAATPSACGDPAETTGEFEI